MPACASIHDQMVLSNIFLSSPLPGKMIQFDSYSSDGLKQSTSDGLATWSLDSTVILLVPPFIILEENSPSCPHWMVVNHVEKENKCYPQNQPSPNLKHSNQSCKIMATSQDLTPNGGVVREIPLFHLARWNIIGFRRIFSYRRWPGHPKDQQKIFQVVWAFRSIKLHTFFW